MEESKHLLEMALKFLSIRPRSRQEVVGYLQKKTSDASLINQIIGKLEKAKLVDDEEFTRWYVESRSRSRPRSARLLALELKSKGITGSLQSAALPENELALSALAKKLQLWSRLPWPQFRAKAGRYLASRGFSWDVIAPVIKAAYNDTHVK